MSRRTGHLSITRVTFIALLTLAATGLSAQTTAPGRSSVEEGCRAGQYKFSGEVTRGQTFSREFDGFVFALRPTEYGWDIDISQGDQHFLANMTGPWHGPNAIYIEGWHFRNSANTGPNTGDVNEPDETRNFLFSPRWPKCEDALGLEKDGNGVLEITDLELGNLTPGAKAYIERMKFDVTLNVGASACSACPPASPIQVSRQVCGVVFDPATNPIPNAMVTIASNGKAVSMVKTDANGQFTFADVRAGEYQLQVASGGFRIERRDIQVLEDQRYCQSPLRVKLDIALYGGPVIVYPPPLLMRVSSITKARYTGSSSPVKVTFVNTTRKPLRILDVFGDRAVLRVFFQLTVRSDDGHLNKFFGGGKVDIPGRRMHYITLQKGGKYEFTLDLTDVTRHFRLPPGGYSFWLEYSNQYGEDCFRGRTSAYPVHVTLAAQ